MKKSFIQFITIIPLVLLLCLTFSCQQQVEQGITEEEAKTIMDTMHMAYNEGALDAIDQVCAPEFVAHFSNQPEDIVGIESFKEFIKLNRIQFPDFNLADDEMIVKGNNIVTRWTLTGANTGPFYTPFGELPPTGKEFRISGLGLFRVADGKITEQWIVFNVLDMLQQLGFMLAPPAPPEPPEEEK